MTHITVMAHLNASDQKVHGVTEWRRRRLERAGFEPSQADALARDRRVDLHAVLELLDRGCPPELAARILAPLDPRGGGE